MKSHFFIRLLISLTLFPGCEKKNESPENEPAGEKICFEWYSVNHAWGLSYGHWIIDEKGNIRVNSKDSIVWLNSTRPEKSIHHFDSVVFKIEAEELSEYVKLLQQASEGRVNCTPQQRADYGENVYNCFSFDQKRNTYKTILLSKKSDLEDCNNTNNAAMKIDAWLRTIKAKLPH